jgi:hypothetical protein
VPPAGEVVRNRIKGLCLLLAGIRRRARVFVRREGMRMSKEVRKYYELKGWAISRKTLGRPSSQGVRFTVCASRSKSRSLPCRPGRPSLGHEKPVPT